MSFQWLALLASAPQHHNARHCMPQGGFKVFGKAPATDRGASNGGGQQATDGQRQTAQGDTTQQEGGSTNPRGFGECAWQPI